MYEAAIVIQNVGAVVLAVALMFGVLALRRR